MGLERQSVKTKKSLSSFALHIMAMAFMVCDHLWGSIVAGNMWLTLIGRLAFPIFAFMIAEGYRRTKSFKSYTMRMLAFALASEVPYDLMHNGTFFDPFQQNVMWTFLIALFTMRGLDKLKAKISTGRLEIHGMSTTKKAKSKLRFKIVLNILCSALLVGAAMLVGQLAMVDYFGEGVLMVIVFYFFKGQNLFGKLCQLVAMVVINVEMMKGLVIPVEIFSRCIEISQQGIAVLSLPLIWLYKGNHGPYNKFIKYVFYAFYPAHMLILGILFKILN